MQGRTSVLTALGCAAILAIAAACSSETTPKIEGPVPTYHKDVAPIVQNVCQRCHVDGGIAPFSLTTYAHAKNVADAIVETTSARKMPPWGAATTTECSPPHPYRDNLRLSDAEIETIRRWRDGGAPEGDPNDAPPPVQARASGLASPDMDLAPAAPFQVSGTSDLFRCFVLDPKLTETRFVNGVRFLPQNPEIVHHAIVYTDPDNATAARADANGSYECFGGPGISNTSLLAAWAPGTGPQEFPSNVGTALAANTRLVLQVHYHPHGQATASDATAVQLRFTKEPPEYEADTRLIGNFPFGFGTEGLLLGPGDPGVPVFLVPAGASQHVETMQLTIPTNLNGRQVPPLYVYGVGAHMHYVGVDEKITVRRAAPEQSQKAEECLLHVPQWDFNWQRGYTYDAPIEKLPLVKPGDRVTVRCTYDNSAKNPALTRALREENATSPRDVRLGESTLDEMCLGAFVFLYKAR